MNRLGHQLELLKLAFTYGLQTITMLFTTIYNLQILSVSYIFKISILYPIGHLFLINH